MATMKIMPASADMASVSGNRMMIVLAALKPGMAPTTRPSTVPARINHQYCMVSPNRPMNTEKSTAIEFGLDEVFHRSLGKPGFENVDENNVTDDGAG